MKVFVDTSAWLALYDRSDQHHHAALTVSERLKGQRAHLIFSDLILAESLTLVRYRMGHAWAVRLGRALLESQVAEMVSVDQGICRRSWDIFKQYDDKDFSVTDCSSFAMMEQRGVRTAFAFDRHCHRRCRPLWGAVWARL